MVESLLVGVGTLTVSLLLYGLVTILIVRLVAAFIHQGYAGPRFWKNLAIMMTVSLLTAFVHLCQVAMWAFVILLSGEIASFENAFYCSAQNYTALGYGDVLLTGRWRLLGPLEAINGLLVLGLSTAVMYAVLSRLIATRLHLQPVSLGEAIGG